MTKCVKFIKLHLHFNIIFVCIHMQVYVVEFQHVLFFLQSFQTNQVNYSFWMCNQLTKILLRYNQRYRDIAGTTQYHQASFPEKLLNLPVLCGPSELKPLEGKQMNVKIWFLLNLRPMILAIEKLLDSIVLNENLSNYSEFCNQIPLISFLLIHELCEKRRYICEDFFVCMLIKEIYTIL